MKIRPGPIVAAILLTGLGAWVYVHEYRGGDRRQRAADAETRPVNFERTDVVGLRIDNAAGSFHLTRADEGWQLVAPLMAPADRAEVDGLLDALQTAHIDRRIGPEADLAAYGLDPPRATLTLDLASSGPPVVLRIGEHAPIGESCFALLPNDGGVALVNAGLEDLASKTLMMLRDKSIIAIDAWKVSRLRIEREGETVVLDKPGSGWQLQSPVVAPADGPTVTDLLNELGRLEARSFVAEEPDDADLARYGLDRPAARMTIVQDGKDGERSVQFGDLVDDARYARLEGSGPVVTVPAEFWARVTTSVFDLRRKDLLSLNRYRVRSIAVVRAGGVPLQLTRGDDGAWTASGLAEGPAHTGSIDTLLAHISDLKATGFIDRPAAGMRAALQSPALQISLEEEAAAEGVDPLRQQLLIGAPDRKSQITVFDPAWEPISVAPSGVYGRILRKLDAIIEQINAPPETDQEDGGEVAADGESEEPSQD